MKNWKLSALLNTPLGVVIVVGSLIAAVELLIMLVILPIIIPEIYWGFADPILLTVIVSPALYFLVFQKILRAEEALQQSKARIKMLLNSVAEGIYGVDMQGNCTFINSAGLRLLGYQEETELMGKYMHEHIHHTRADGSHYPAAECRLYHCLQSHEDIHVDDELFWRKDGSSFPVDYWSRPTEQNGKTVGAAITFFDITERKRAEDSLRKLSLAVEQSPNSIVITDLDANIEYANAAFAKATGYSLAEAIGQNPRLLHSGKTPRATYDDLWAHLTRGEVWKGEFINRRKDGSEYIESALISPVYQADGRVTNYLAIKEDITEYKRIESDLGVNRAELEMQNEELRLAQITLEESRDQFVDLYEFSPVGYLTLNHEEMIDEINLTATALLGLERNKLLHHRFAPCVATEDRDRWHRHFLDVLQHDGQQRCELALRRSDDSVFHAQLDCLHVNAGGTSSVRVALTDITERKLVEAKLAEQLDELRGWHDITLGREMRVLDLKHEVDELLGQAGQPPRYPSAESDDPQEK